MTVHSMLSFRFFIHRASNLCLAIGTLLVLLFAAPLLADGDHGRSCGEASQLGLGESVAGLHESRLDRDHFRVDVERAGILTVEAEASGPRESRLRFLGRGCESAARAEVRWLERSDARQVMLVEERGSYYFQIVGPARRAGDEYRITAELATEPEEVDLLYQLPYDAADTCDPWSGESDATGTSEDTDELDPDILLSKSEDTDELDPDILLGTSEDTDELDPDILLDKSEDTDELDPDILLGQDEGDDGSVIVLSEDTDELDPDILLISAAKSSGYLVIDAEGVAVTAALYDGADCSSRSQVVADASLADGGKIAVPAGRYFLRIEAEPGAAGRYWLRVKHLVHGGG